MNTAHPILVCFAVREEAAPFRRIAPSDTEILVTGMGSTQAARCLRERFTHGLPRLLLTSGFAGGLNPDLSHGMVLFDAKPLPILSNRLAIAGAHPGQFHCADRVAVTAGEKRHLRATTGADAVEMESKPLRDVCRERDVPSATVRVILDPADMDLPLDFNALLTPQHTLHFGRLLRHLLASPAKVPRLLRFQRQCTAAAQQLANVLAAALPFGQVK